MKKKVFNGTQFLFVICLLSMNFNVWGAPGKRLGIATYSVKGIESDIEGSFKALAADGYVVMEISNYNAAEGKVAGYSPADYAALAEKSGLDIISSHARASFNVKDVEGTLAAWGKVFDDHKAMGCKYVVFPMNFWANTVEGLKAECALMNKIGEEANLRGLKFGYHNHSFEFAKVPGTDMYFEDFLIQNTYPGKVFFQMDVYWVTIGGESPVEYLKKYPDRFKVLHIKDDYVIGESGTIDYKPIFEQFYKNGGADWFVEMENKMTPEQKAGMMTMMEGMKKRMVEGGGNPFGPPPAGQQGGGNQQARPAAQRPPMPAADPERMASQLKASLEGIRQSAEFLKKSDFVK